MLLLFLVMGFGFSGYLLPWNTLAFFATKVGTEITGQVPIVGKPMMIFLRGGEEVTGATLTGSLDSMSPFSPDWQPC
jgi:quinol-cytochrome oxidoreductase complex cytochrome b subunit